MKRFLPIVVVFLLLVGAGYFLLLDDSSSEQNVKAKPLAVGEFNRVRGCATIPKFLYSAGIKRPIIDLSQEKYTGIAFYYGKNFSKVLHKKEWEKFENLGTYTIDSVGDIYLTPNPFISIKATTFNLQKAIYKIDSSSGDLSRWMVIDEIKPTANNPYGLISIVYDCDDGTLWASAIDKSGYKGSKGRIYHINPKTKEIIEKIENFDALTINILKSKKAKYLLAGSAIDNSLYAFEFKDKKINKTPFKLLSLPDTTLHIRKVRVIGKNRLKIEAIKFSYSLIAASDTKKRYIYSASYNSEKKSWQVVLED